MSSMNPNNNDTVKQRTDSNPMIDDNPTDTAQNGNKGACMPTFRFPPITHHRLAEGMRTVPEPQCYNDTTHD